MGDRIRHRGPDSAGTWCDEAHGVALSHQRLAILDLSPAGHQPMQSPAGRYVMAYNGEVYNHLELRLELERAGTLAGPWRGHSDTETLLAAFETWGVKETLLRCRGMFAFALWDRAERALWLGRDRMGEKPLYYGWAGGAFLFASEAAAFEAFPGFTGQVDHDALAAFLRFGYVPAPQSIYRHCYKLWSGGLLRIELSVVRVEPSDFSGQVCHMAGLRLERWWSHAAVADAAEQDLITDDQTALTALSEALGEACELQMLSDVPLGAFLSGGIDSSLIVALMQSRCARPVRTFTVGFREQGFDESGHAARVAAHLGTRHTTFEVGASELLDIVPSLPTIYSEPFADVSQVPTHLVARLARREVTVALNGDGADELFGGYNRYRWGPQSFQCLRRVPRPLRSGLAALLDGLSERPSLNRHLGRLGGVAQAPAKLAKLAAATGAVDNEAAFYIALASTNPQVAELVEGGASATHALRELIEAHPQRPFARRMMQADAVTYLPDDILCKVDRAAMAVSLETRTPYLDLGVIALAARLPQSLCIRGQQTKWLLRQLLAQYLPAEWFTRPKQGFSVPLDVWLRGPLRDWAESLLSYSSLEHGLFDAEQARALWQAHQTGRVRAGQALWSVLMFQAWWQARGQR